MHIKPLLPTFFLNFYAINAAILLWSNRPVQISPLMPFDDGDLDILIKNLEVKNVYRFKVALKHRNALVPKNLKEVIDGYYSTYNPNGNVGTLNATELFLSEDCNGIDTAKIQMTTGKLTNFTTFLCVLDITYPRKKRAVDTILTSEDNPKDHKNFVPKGAVIYIGHNKKDKQYALLYSSKPLKIEINNTTRYLGNTDNDLITVDKRVNIPIAFEGKGKVIFRFLISGSGGYWSINTVKVELFDESGESYSYDLTTDENIMAPAHFSYHCNGQSVFVDPVNGTKLTIYDLQVQVDAKKQRFGDANDCVPFTTAPIWSGLFVATILGFGLIIALTAIMDIKTMDKFDNHATKNLGITVMD